MKQKKLVNVLVLAALTMVLTFYTQATQEYRLYFWEEQHLFLFDYISVLGQLGQPGGVALLLSSFAAQFMALPYAGAAIMFIIYVLATWLLAATLRILSVECPTGKQLVDNEEKEYRFFCLAPLALLPSVFLFLGGENIWYRFQADVAFVLLLLAVRLYLCARRWRVVVGIVLTALLYVTAGSVAVVFAVTALTIDVLRYGLRGLWALTCCGVAVACGAIAVLGKWCVSLEEALTPLMYYDWASSYFVPLYAWLLIPVLSAIALIFSRFMPKGQPRKQFAFFYTISIALSVYLPINLYGKAHNHSQYLSFSQQRWAQEGNWQRILMNADHRYATGLLSYPTLALAQRGELAVTANFVNWLPPQQSLVAPGPKEVQVKTMLANVYYECSYIAAAQQAAFEGNLITPGGCNGKLMQKMIDCSLILGKYGVAEKYIAKLEKTLFYSEWATARRAFLYNDAAIEADPVLGRHRRSLPANDVPETLKHNGFLGDLEDILALNPEQRITRQFAELYKKLTQNQPTSK